MASAVSPSRKRKSSSTQSDDGSSSRKRMKDGEKIQSSSQSKRSKSKSKKDIKASLKTVSELAKLVTSGAVQVPKSLVNYTTDKALLLDQVFTILSPNDVNGMLPDILKGLKLKRVKSLCYAQLKGMSEEEIKQALQPEDKAASTSAPPEVTSSTSNEIQTSNDRTDNVSNTKVDRQLKEESEGASDCCFHSEKEGRTSEKSQVLDTKDFLPLSQPHDKEMDIHISDVSGDEEERDTKQINKAKDKEEAKIHGQLERSKNDSDETFRQEEERKRSVEPDKDHVCEEPDEVRVCSESESGGGGNGEELDVGVGELDAAQLLEMKMRRRALESELKKFATADKRTTMKPRSLPNRLDLAVESEEDYIEVCVSDSDAIDSGFEKEACQRREEEEEERDSSADAKVDEVENETMDSGELLEILLRQKALQSLLNKKKQNPAQ